MGLWGEVKQRRITQIVVAYLAAGWMANTVVDQLVNRGVLPEVVYSVTLTLYLFGIGAASVIGWYHGEKGVQKAPVSEIALLSVLGIAAFGASVVLVRRYGQAESVLPPGAMNALYDPRRVAVLYLDDLSGGSDELGAVADGLTEALIDELGRVPELDVISRNGVSPYRGNDVAPDSIGRSLNAGSVIKGSIETAGARLRVTLRLVDTESGVDIDRTSFELPAGELLSARDSLATQSARFLRTRLGEEVRVRERRAGTSSVEAWTLVQRGERFRKEADETRPRDLGLALTILANADSLFSTVEAFDPAWTEPTVLRAQVALTRGTWAMGRDEDGAIAAVQSGIELSDRVIQRDANNARAWEARGTLHQLYWYLNVSPTQQERAVLLDAAQSDLERAVELDPSLAGALSRLSGIYYYERADRIRGALTARQALTADSYLRDAAGTLDRLFWAHYDMGQFAEAGRTCREAEGRLPQDPRFKRCELWMMITPTGEPDPAVAWSLLAQVDSLTSPAGRPLAHATMAIVVSGVLARSSLPDSARSVLLRARVGPEVDPELELPGYEAIVRTILGDYDEAVQQLRRYVSAHPDHQFIEVEGDVHWWWRPLRDHPGFAGVAAPGG